MEDVVYPQAAASWKMLADRAATEMDERRRSNLELVARHVDAEVRGDTRSLMATLVDEPVYRIFGASDSPGPEGQEAVGAFYEASISSGKNRLEYDLERVIVDGDAVVTEGTFRHAFRGEVLLGRGLAEGSEADPNGWYLVEYRALVVWPVTAEGLLAGEDVYAGERPRVVRQLADGEAPHLGPVGRSSVGSSPVRQCG